jgi:hypothetical protein
MANGPNQPPGQQQQPQQPVDEFELMRRRIRQRAGAAGEGRQRELTRRFAALGQAPSGAAFRIRQEAQEATERAQSEQLQDVAALEAQTRRQEREGEAQRGLQRELAGEQRGLQRELAQQQAETQLAVTRLGTESAERLGALDAQTRQALGQMDFDARMKQMQVADDTARFLGKMELDNQVAIADLDRQLRRDGTNIENMLAEQQIADSAKEGTLNSFATFVNSVAPLREAGLNPAQISAVFDELELGLPNDVITGFLQQNFPDFVTDLPAPGTAPAPAQGQRTVIARQDPRGGREAARRG